MTKLSERMNRLPENIITHGTGDRAHLQINRAGAWWAVSYVTNRKELIYVTKPTLEEAVDTVYKELDQGGYL